MVPEPTPFQRWEGVLGLSREDNEVNARAQSLAGILMVADGAPCPRRLAIAAPRGGDGLKIPGHDLWDPSICVVISYMYSYMYILQYKYNTIQYNTIQYTTIQYNTIQYVYTYVCLDPVCTILTDL